MKKFAYGTAVVALAAMLAMCGAAFADPGGPPQDGMDKPGGPGDGEKFEDVKARILDRMRQAEKCVEAAQTPDALRACKPQRPPARGGGDESGGPQ